MKKIMIALCMLILLTLPGCQKETQGTSSSTQQEEEASQKEKTPESEKTQKESTEPSDTESEQDEKSANSTEAERTELLPLHVEGTQLTDSNGKAAQLKGISTHGIAWFPDYINEECFRELHENWNVNVIRLAMYTAESGGYCTDGDKEYLKNLVRNGVSYATAQNMYVIIDWHILSDNNPNQHLEEAKEFFAEMSAEYADYDNVLYEICNEPNGGTSWSDIKSYAVEVIETIRSNDKDGIIIVGTPNWSQYVDQAAENPITGYDNIMYTLHFYAATHKDDLRSKMKEAVEKGLPVFVSEYGICDASGSGEIDEVQANEWVTVMNEYGISYVAWNLSNKSETSAIFDSSCSKVSGFEESDLSASGKWLYHMLTGKENLTASGTAQVGSGTAQSGSGTAQSGSSTSQTGSGTSQADSGTSQLSSADGTKPASGSGGNPASSDNLEYSVELKNSWESNGQTFYQYSLTLENNSLDACESWAVDVSFSEVFTFSEGWNGDYSVSGKVLHISAKDYNGSISAGDSVSDIGFIVAGSKNLQIEEK